MLGGGRMRASVRTFVSALLVITVCGLPPPPAAARESNSKFAGDSGTAKRRECTCSVPSSPSSGDPGLFRRTATRSLFAGCGGGAVRIVCGGRRGAPSHAEDQDASCCGCASDYDGTRV
ncbi:hypothetical protein FIBSPDRAFT_502628 [Athelia psychrophila]|uniref:Secreted protein n=1 Tax=Athelia psychrophila TaxID=1759441 RepID=A0A166K4R2_9AGAM|nr:hypothetical protein FIBSPDRAFT_502628 [Fibularhizoctonia sp. CBS 109695]